MIPRYRLSPPAHGATEILYASSNLGWGRESQARPNFFPLDRPDTSYYTAASPRSGQPLENGQPPCRIRGPIGVGYAPASHGRPGIGYAPRRHGRPLEDGQPPPRIRDAPSRKRGLLPPKLLGSLPPKAKNLLNVSSPWPVTVQPVSSEINLSAPDTDTGVQLESMSATGVIVVGCEHGTGTERASEAWSAMVWHARDNPVSP